MGMYRPVKKLFVSKVSVKTRITVGFMEMPSSVEVISNTLINCLFIPDSQCIY